MSEEPAQQNRHSWTPSLMDRTDSPSSPQSSTSPAGRYSVDFSNLLHRQGSRGSRNKKYFSEYKLSDHKRTSSTFSSSQYSSPATTISRPGTPDSIDCLTFDKDFESFRRPLSGLSQSATGFSTKSTHSNRWSSTSSTIRHSISEQERVLQDKLQELARSDNARLAEFDKVSPNLTYSPVNSRPISSILPTSKKRSSMKSPISHKRSFSLQPFLKFENNPSFPTEPLSVTESKSDVSKDEARASALAALSGDSIMPLSRKGSKTSAKNQRRSVMNGPGYFVISEMDLERLGNASQAEAGPASPGDIGGTIFSWHMASDIIKAWAVACKSPESLCEITYFIWAMISNPPSVYDINLRNFCIMPPPEIVKSLKDGITSVVVQTSFESVLGSLAEFGNVLGKGICAGFAFMVIFIQVSLLSVMVFAYVLGDMLMVPIKKTGGLFKEQLLIETEVNSSGEQAKSSALKAQRLAKKAITRRSRSKRRSRHHN